jgi:hypothetical protein
MTDIKIGYCTNVHAGTTYSEIKQNLRQYSLAVKEAVSPDESMGIGLWFSAEAVGQMANAAATTEFQQWLDECGLFPFTFNAFPFSDFHQPIVKHKVYEPTWAQTSRLDYTLAIARLQSTLLPVGSFGTISTLPLGWPTKLNDGFLESCARNLIHCANELKAIHQETGRQIFLCIEPEPGCILDTSDDLVSFFENYLFSDSAAEETIRNYIGVCHDVCHSAVMFEPQTVALNRFAESGIHVGKFQISSAIAVDFDAIHTDRQQDVLSELSRFAEDRYLHQTMVRGADGNLNLLEDLSIAIDQHQQNPTGQWRIHFHVPIFAESVGSLSTTQNEIAECIAFELPSDLPVHYEVETYAWTVLPENVRPKDLATGIAQEMKFLLDLI